MTTEPLSADEVRRLCELLAERKEGPATLFGSGIADLTKTQAMKVHYHLPCGVILEADVDECGPLDEPGAIILAATVAIRQVPGTAAVFQAEAGVKTPTI